MGLCMVLPNQVIHGNEKHLISLADRLMCGFCRRIRFYNRRFTMKPHLGLCVWAFCPTKAWNLSASGVPLFLLGLAASCY